MFKFSKSKHLDFAGLYKKPGKLDKIFHKKPDKKRGVWAIFLKGLFYLFFFLVIFTIILSIILIFSGARALKQSLNAKSELEISLF